MNVKIIAVSLLGCALGACTGLQDLVGCSDAGATIDVNEPILPGWGKYFWNANAQCYIHPPAFDFGEVAGAAEYRFTVARTKGTNVLFSAKSPKESLKSVWLKLPKMGFFTVTVEGVAADGRVLGVAGTASFFRNPPFVSGSSAPAARPYGEAAKMVYDYLFSLPAMKEMAETGKPDEKKQVHYHYPSKTHAAVINAAVSAAERDPSRKDFLLKLARASADYLIATSEPEGAPLAGFAQTYTYKGSVMMIYPASAATAYLNLYGATGEKKYFEAAERTARKYLELQGEDGTWYLKLSLPGGKPVAQNRLFPLSVCSFLEKMYALTKDAAYRAAADRAFAYVERVPLANWNWEGQFEDVNPTPTYENLTKHSPVDTAMYLVKRYPGDKERLRQARLLMTFAEDQFVQWEKPVQPDFEIYRKELAAKRPKGGMRNSMDYPTTFEQYYWYVPIDSSVAKMIFGYLAMYAATGNPVDLEKAKAFGATLTRVQEKGGRIQTEWPGGRSKPQYDWWNCMVASAKALEQLAEVTR